VYSVMDGTGATSIGTYRLSADRSKPQITLVSPLDGESHDIQNDLIIHFQASKANGLVIETPGVTDINSSNDYTAQWNMDCWSVTIPKEDLSEGDRVFEIHVTDRFGNTQQQRFTLGCTALPVLQYISSNQANGIYGIGESIEILAVFSRPVDFSTLPEVLLSLTPEGNSQTYSCTGGNGTDTLIFSYVVDQGVISTALCSSYPTPLQGGVIDGVEPAELNTLITLSDTADSLQERKALQLDAISPSFYTMAVTGGFYRQGSIISISITLGESVFVAGSPSLNISSPPGEQAEFVSASSDVLHFQYQVPAGVNQAQLELNASSVLSGSEALIYDLAGNILSPPSSAANQGFSDVVIDTTTPDAPVITAPLTGSYNSAQELILTGVEDGASVEYSRDGGMSWQSWIDGEIISANGNWTLLARQRDASGNISAVSNQEAVVIDGVFPSLVSMGCQQPDGTYKEGDILTFKLTFDSPVLSDGSAEIELHTLGTAVSREVSSGSTVLYFDYTIPAGDFVNPLTIDSDALNSQGIEDPSGNTPDSITLPSLNRPSLIIDAVAPGISVTSPSHLGVIDAGANISLTFDEPIFKETGTIVLQRQTDWLVPPVLSVEEFNSYYYQLSTADKELLITTDATETQGNSDDDFPLLDDNGKPYGPYILLTHGVGTDNRPDLTGKYLLDYNIDLDNSSIKTALAQADYHRIEVDVQSSQVTVTGNTVTLNLLEDLPIGIDWFVTVSAGSFRDSAGNNCAAYGGEGSWDFSSDQVSTPVIRVNRVSGDYTTTTFRVDCQTPGAEILYITDQVIYADGGDMVSAQGGGNRYITSATDLDAFYDTTIPSMGTPETDYSTELTIGNLNYNDAMRIFIKAQASRSGLDDYADLGQSELGSEGAYKTVLGYTSNPGIMGSDNGGGPPVVPGFPFAWPLNLEPHDTWKTGDYINDGTPGTGGWHYITWEIIADFEYKWIWADDPNLAGIYGGMSIDS
ncbi:MAG: hypothetical protein PF447_01585, partial [Spirochaetaceae bacterium]|nr:hypothetical protein [Spirochaetaceae bacterium]